MYMYMQNVYCFFVTKLLKLHVYDVVMYTCTYYKIIINTEYSWTWMYC